MLTRLRTRLIRVIALLILAQLWAGATFAWNPGEFPGKGTYQTWIEANNVFDSGNALKRDGKFIEAAAQYRRAIEMYPFDPSYYINLGVALQKTGELRESEAASRKAIALDDHHWNAWNTLGNVLEMEGRLTDARDAFQKGLGTSPPPNVVAAFQHEIDELSAKISKAQ